ncbi:heavy metal-binding protein HIP-like [Mytilus edulis]|uniref:heavy metal-binding protein HIP-like n=1 Tax=Mytilus edulis TaxID=6550 RepID=UPI0039F1375F
MVSSTLVLLLLCVNVGKALASCNSGKTTCVTEDLLHMIMRAAPAIKDSNSQTDLKRRPTFFASLKPSQTLASIKDIVKFNDVKINIGGGYDSSTGIFTAPRSGIYIISCTIMASGSSEVQFQLNKNDQLYTNGYATKSGYAAQTINSLVDLRKGDKMYIKHRTGASQPVYGEHFSTFSGYLLSE